MITQTRLKELLNYDLETGVFTWRVSRGGVLAGSVAGYFDGGGYCQIRINGKNYLAHRLAFLYTNGSFPSQDVDHINHDPADNRWENLRAVTKSQNQRNATKRTDNTSGFSGVTWHKNDRKWQANARIDGKLKHLGSFDDINDAVAARIRFNRENGFYKNHGAEKGVV